MTDESGWQSWASELAASLEAVLVNPSAGEHTAAAQTLRDYTAAVRRWHPETDPGDGVS